MNKGPQTVQALEATFSSLGYTVQSRSYRANLDNRSGYGDGYLQAQMDLDSIYQSLIEDFENPTRLILVAHSHGAQFASLLAMDNPDVSFDYFDYLDGICLLWERDHLVSGAFARHYGFQYNYPSPLNILGSACNSFWVPGLGFEDIKDVVPDNVKFALEVRSSGFWHNGLFIKDYSENTRANGSKGPMVGLATISEHEGHNQVDAYDSDAMLWVENMIVLNNLPKRYLRLQSNPSLRLAPAPKDFSY